jgi:RNA polymerase sigma factor (sigma-70 family)
MWRSSKTDHQWLKNLLNGGTASRQSDADLLKRFLSGSNGASEDAFESLLRRHGPMVLSVCQKIVGDPHDAEDAFQATFFILATQARSIREQRSVASWLHGVALRVASRLRASAERRRTEERRLAEIVILDDDPEAARPEDDPLDHEALHQEVQRLPSKYREAIVLCYLQGMTQEAIAGQLGCSTSTVGVRLMRARAQLKARLSRRGISRSGGVALASLLLLYTRSPMRDSLAASTKSLVRGSGGTLSPAVALITAEVLKSAVKARSTRIGPLVMAATLTTASLGIVITSYALHRGVRPGNDPSAVAPREAPPRDRARIYSQRSDESMPAAVPEPSTLVIAAMMATILGGYAYLRRGKTQLPGACRPNAAPAANAPAC